MKTTFILLILFFLYSCSHSLAPTPALFNRPGYEDPFKDLPENQKHPEVEILYVTDRMWDEDESNYGVGRSRILFFGECKIQFGELNTWQKIYATTKLKDHDITLDLTEITQKGTFATPFPEIDEENKLPRDNSKFVEFVENKLKNCPKKEVFIFIHGFNNTFEYAVKTTSQVWHYLGRQGLGISYSWPSGTNGLFGYGADKESGDFTVFHLKQFLRSLYQCESIEKINILAHSRGTDVTTTALRELQIELKQQGKSLQEMKLNNLILAAADIDIDVFSQRIVAEGLLLAPKRLTLYLGAGDRALNFSQSMNISAKRLGLVNPVDLKPEGRKLIQKWSSVNLIYIPETLGFISHSYFIDDPAVSSDLILLIRDDKSPGAENGRPLIKDPSGMWILKKDYPQFEPKKTFIGNFLGD
jgi:esterase/lipase superfamily enzyme